MLQSLALQFAQLNSVPMWQASGHVGTLLQILNSLDTPDFRRHFSDLTNNTDRVALCFSQQSVTQQIDQFISNLKFSVNRTGTGLKWSDNAAKYREAGNEHFRASRYLQSIEAFSNAILNAPKEPQTKEIARSSAAACKRELPLAYGNRSAAYFQLGLYEYALLDIEAALELRYHAYGDVNKLKCRKVECLLRLGRAEEARRFFATVSKSGDAKSPNFLAWNKMSSLINGTHKYPMPKMIPQPKTLESTIEVLTAKGLFKSHSKLASLSSKVDVCYNPKKGRHLVAKEKIECGQILMVTRPYVQVLNAKFERARCHHCSCPMFLDVSDDGGLLMLEAIIKYDGKQCKETPTPLRPMPCHQCSIALYCSEDCRAQSWQSYHRFECGFHAFLFMLNDFQRLALRLLYSTGLDKIRAVAKKQTTPDAMSNLADPIDYSFMYQLVHDSDKKCDNETYREMLENTVTACLAVRLAKLSGFLAKTKKDTEKFVGSIILRHIYQIKKNSCSEFDLASPDSKVPFSVEIKSLYLANHSCAPNAHVAMMKYHQRNGFFQAAQSIAAGSEITISYQTDFTAFKCPNLQERKQLILQQLGFVCECAQCLMEQNNIPNGIDSISPLLASVYYPIGCDKCGALVINTGDKQCQSYRCSKCSVQVELAEMQSKYAQIEMNLTDARTWIQQINGFDIGGENFESFFDNKFVNGSLLHRQTSPQLYQLYRQLCERYSRLMLRSESLIYAEKCLAIVEAHFGSPSLALYEEIHTVLPIDEIRGCAEIFDEEAYKRILQWNERYEEIRRMLLF